MKLRDRFLQFVCRQDPDSPCWIWTGYTCRKGYGRFHRKGKSKLAHRASYEIHFGVSLDDETEVHHECGNRSCVNPDHLSALEWHDHRDWHEEEPPF